MQEQFNNVESITYKDKKRYWPLILTFLVLIILLLGLVVAVYLSKQTTNVRSKAYTYEQNDEQELTNPNNIEIDNSFAFASPLQAATGGEKIRITVMILDGRGIGVSGQSVVLSNNNSIVVEELQPVTDDYGKAIFDISSSASGDFIITPSVNNQPLSQNVQVRFK